MTATPENGQEAGPSRYERVKNMLNEAQGRAMPDYQGYRAFWLLPIDELLEVEIYGQRMIAPPWEGDAPGTVALVIRHGAPLRFVEQDSGDV